MAYEATMYVPFEPGPKSSEVALQRYLVEYLQRAGSRKQQRTVCVYGMVVVCSVLMRVACEHRA